MDMFKENGWSFALVSGVAEVFWLGYTFIWGWGYYCSFEGVRFVFHYGVMAWLFTTNLFYILNILYDLYPINHLQVLNWVCFSLYMTVTYFMGFCVSLGFGTTHLYLHLWEWMLVTGIAGVICLVSFLEFLYFQSLYYAYAAITLVIFGVQIIITYLTIKKLILEYELCKDSSRSMLVPLTYRRVRVMTVFCVNLNVLFVLQALETYLVYVDNIGKGKIYMWLVWTISNSITEGVSLWLTRPRKELLNISLEARLEIVSDSD